jgi:hypothetical protein
MSRFFTDTYVRSRAALRGEPIEGDRPCDGCAYNLRGLRWGARCPECGLPIRYRRTLDIRFEELPMPVIRRFRTGSLIAVVGLAGIVAAQSLAWIVLWTVNMLAVWTLLLVLLCACLWVYGAWRLTEPLEVPQAAILGLGQQSRLRLCARWLQVAWLVYALTIFGSWQSALTGISMLVGIGGVLALCVYLGRLSSWVRNDLAERVFNATVWGTAMGTSLLVFLVLLTLALRGRTLAFVPFVAGLAALFVLGSLAAFPVGLVSLARSLGWAAFHASERADRSRALADRVAPRPSRNAPRTLLPSENSVAGDHAPISLAGPGDVAGGAAGEQGGRAEGQPR